MITIMKTGSPTINTKGLVGQHYIDLDSGTEYECVDIIDHRQYKKGLVKPHDFVSQKVLNGVSCEYIWEVIGENAAGGGSGSGSGIYTLNAVLHSHINSEYVEEYEIVGCSREDLILAAKDSKAIYNIVLKNTAEHNPYSSEQYLITTLTYDEDDDKICMICAGTGSYYYWNSDGTFEIYAD